MAARSRVTVCIPVYNGAKYIAESIASVLRQTNGDFRVIVCDNCSTDETADVVNRFADPRLSYVRNPRNLGPVGNFNRCLDLAVDEYVCLWHHDDVMLPDNLDRKVAFLDDHPRVGFVHSNSFHIDQNGDPWHGSPEHGPGEDSVSEGRAWFRWAIVRPMLVCCPSVVARRACYQALGGFRTDLPHANDVELWLRLSLYYDVGYIGKPLLNYRWHPQSASASAGELRTIWEEYRGRGMLFSEHRHRIEGADELQRQAYLALSARALQAAYAAFCRSQFSLGRACLRAAVRIRPSVVAEPAFWPLAVRVTAGRTGGRLYRALRGVRG